MARAYAIRCLPFVALVFAGAAVLALAGDDTVGFVIGFGMVGLGAVLLVSLLFYEVGRSEDRSRAHRRRGHGRRAEAERASREWPVAGRMSGHHTGDK